LADLSDSDPFADWLMPLRQYWMIAVSRSAGRATANTDGRATKP
jgi:hypothetical protein